MLHITQKQYKYIYQVFDDKTFGCTADLDTDLEVIGCGLDASLIVNAWLYEGRQGLMWSFIDLSLKTFKNGGDTVDNDFDKNYFIELYKQAA